MLAKILREKEYEGTWLISEKTTVLLAELIKRAEAVTSSHFTTGNFLQCIYSVLVVKNHLKFKSGCFQDEFSFKGIF